MVTNQPIGTVVAVEGEVQIRGGNGQLSTVSVGETIYQGETVVTGADGRIALDAGGRNPVLVVEGGQTVAMTLDLLEPETESQDFWTDSVLADASIDEVLQALEEGGEIDDLLEATAAGSSTEEGHGFVRLLRISEGVNPEAFEFTAASAGDGLTDDEQTGSELPPEAIDDAAIVEEDGSVTIDVLANDSDPDGDPITLINFTQGGNGTVTLDPVSGNPVYTPNPDFNGPDSFTYTISDPLGNTSTATVTIDVTPVNDAPVANPDVRAATEDDPDLVGNVIAATTIGERTDTDVDGDALSVVGISHDGDAGSVGVPVAGEFGVLLIGPDGSYSYQISPDLQALGDGDSRTDVFEYTISDGELQSSTTLTITISGSNDGPVARPDLRVTTEDIAISGNVITAPNIGEGQDTDAENDPLTVVGVSYAGTDGTVGQAIDSEWGTLTLDADGSYTYAPNANAQTLSEGQTRTESFTYTITDGAETATTTLMITVTGSNDGPVANADVRSVDEDGPALTGNVISAPNPGEQADTDIENDVLSVVAVNGDAGAVGNPLVNGFGTLTLNEDGSYEFTPGPDAQALDDGDSQVEQFTYTISDGLETATTTLTITITGSNDAPVAQADVRVLHEDLPPVAGNVITAPEPGEQVDFDVDGDPLTVTDVSFGGAPGVVGGPIAGALGTLVLNADGSYLYTMGLAAQMLDDGDVQDDVFTYTISDGDETSTTTLTISVQGRNEGPIANADVRTIDEDSAGISGNVITAPNAGEQADTDLDGDTLSIVAVNGSTAAVGNPLSGTWGTLTLNGDGSYTFVPSAAAQALDDGDAVIQPFTYTVSDGDLTDTTTLTITVTGSNDGPVANADMGTTPEDTPVTIPVLANDTDVDGDTLTVTQINGAPVLVGDPVPVANGTVTLNADGTLTFDPADNYTGPVNFDYTITDGDETSTAGVSITVTSVNDPPVANADVRSLDEDSAGISGNVIDGLAVGDEADTDVDGDTLSVTAIDGDPLAVGTALVGTWGTLTLNGDGSYSFVPSAQAQTLDDGESEQQQYTYTVSDGDLTDTTTLTITVTGSNDGPVANADVRTVGADSAGIAGNVIDGLAVGDEADTDVDGDTLSVTAIDGDPLAVGTALVGTWGTLTLNGDGSYSFVPSAAAQALDDGESEQQQYTYTVSDGDLTDTTTLTITVTGSNDGPVANADVRSLDEDSAGISGNVIDGLAVGDEADTDVDGDTLSVTAIDGDPLAVGTALVGTWGTLTLNGDGSYSFVPSAQAQTLDDGESEQQQYTYTVSDGDLTDTTTLTITVTGSNDGPVANADVRSVDEDSAGISGNVITAPNAGEQSDTDVDGDTLSVTAIDGDPLAVGTALVGTWGTLTLNGDGSYSFVPSAQAQTLDDGESEQQQYTYTVSDGDLTDTTTLTITVTGSNDGPVANADVRSLDEDSAGISGNVIDGLAVGDEADTDVDGDTLSVTAIDGDPLAVGTALVGTWGTLTLNGDGSYSFVPSAQAQTLDDGESEQQQYTYTVSDGDLTDTTTLTITVTGSNDGPVANADVRSLDEDSAGISGNVIDGLAVGDEADTDVDGDTLSVTAIDGDPLAVGTALVGTWGTLTLNGDGSYSFVPSAQAQTLDDGESEQQQYTYTVSDGDLTDTTTLTITVTGSNDGPVANADVRSLDEDSAGISGNVIDGLAVGDEADTDVDGDTLSVTAIDGDPLAVGTALVGTWGTLTLNGDGSYSFVPSAQAQTLDDGESEQQQYTYTVSDGDLTDTTTLTITVTGSNDGPVANADVRTVGADSAGIAGNVIDGLAVGDEADTDVDGDTLSVTAIDGDPLAVGTALVGTWGTLTLNGDGSYSFVPSAQAQTLDDGESEQQQYTYTVSDGDLTDTTTLTITVTGSNDGPVANADVRSLDEDSAGISGNVIDGLAVGDEADTDVDGDTLSVTAIDGDPLAVGTALVGTWGTLTLNGDGSYSFVPSAQAQTLDDGESEQQQYTYTVSDGDLTDTTTLTITVTGSNDGPVANADVRTVGADSAGIAGNVIDGLAVGDEADTDVDGDTLSVTAIDGDPLAVGTALVGTWGTLTLNGDGSYSFVPSAQAQTLDDGESEQQQYTYTVSDGDLTDTTTLTITVTGSNDGPVANADVRSLNEDSAGISGNVIDGLAVGDEADTDVDGDTLSVTAIDGDPLAVGTALVGTWGTLTLNGDGSYSFVPSAQAQTLDDGESEQQQYTYTVSDGDLTDTTTLTITVTGSNDGPVANADVRTVGADSAGIAGNVIDGLAVGDEADTDVDGDTLSVTAIDGDPLAVGTALVGTWGTLTLNGDGSYSFVPSAQAQTLDDGESEQQQYTYTVSDGDLTDTTTLTITVTGSNDGPVANADVRSLDEDSAGISGNVITAPNAGEQADTDVDGDTLSVTAIDGDPLAVGTALVGTWGTLTLNGDGSYSFVPSAQAQTLDDGESEQQQYTYTVSDGDLTDTTTLTITVTGSNDGPVANADVRSLDEDSAGISGNVIDGLAVGDEADTDVDGDTLSVTAIDGDPLAVGTALVGTWGTLTLNGDGSYSFVPSAQAQTLDDGESEQQQYTYTVSDGDLTDTTTLTITVTGSNDGPVANADVRSLDEDSAGISGNVITAPNAGEQADTDVDGDTLSVTAIDGDPLAVGTALVGTWGTLTLNGDGSYSFVPSAQAQTLDDGESEQQQYTYTVSDGDLTDTTTLTITVTGSNDGPVANADMGTTPEDTPVTIAVLSNDTDVDGDVLTVTQINGTPVVAGDTVPVINGTVTLNADGTLTFVPTDDYSGPVNFDYTISDGTETDTATVTITVTGDNDAPVVADASGNISEEGIAVIGIADTNGTVDTTDSAIATGTVTITDIEGDTITSVTLTAPTEMLTSNGETIVWSGSGTSTLIGTAGIGGPPVATVSIDSGGNYTMELLRGIDHPIAGVEDTLDINFGVVASDGTDTGSGTLTITVEDDAPTADDNQHSLALVDTNVMIVLDISGSMNTTDGVGGETRLQSAITAVNTLLTKYEEFGDVAVRLVVFSSGASALTDASGNEWMTVTNAATVLAGLTASSTTNYDAALGTAISAFGASGSLTGAQNVSYFMSDGLPNRPYGDPGIQADEEAVWSNFLQDNLINSYSIGMGSGVDPTSMTNALNPIAYDGQMQENTNSIIVSDFNQLDEVLIRTVQDDIEGDLVSGGSMSTGAGADSGYVSAVNVDGSEYTFDRVGNLISVTGVDNSVWNAATSTLSVTTALGGVFNIGMASGRYTYESPTGLSAPDADEFTFTLVDNDGDSATGSVQVNIDEANIIKGTSGDDIITGTDMADIIYGRGGTDTLDGAGGADRLIGANGADTLIGGRGADELFGNAGDDSLSGGLGRDFLTGGSGNDSLIGGANSDVFIWELADRGAPGAPAVDTVADFNDTAVSSGGDVLDLSDLLQGEDAGSLTEYLHFEIAGSDTIVHVSSEGNFASGYDANQVDQTIVIQGVDFSDGGSLSNDMQIIQDLLNKGNLLTD